MREFKKVNKENEKSLIIFLGFTQKTMVTVTKQKKEGNILFTTYTLNIWNFAMAKICDK